MLWSFFFHVLVPQCLDPKNFSSFVLLDISLFIISRYSKHIGRWPWPCQYTTTVKLVDSLGSPEDTVLEREIYLYE